MTLRVYLVYVSTARTEAFATSLFGRLPPYFNPRPGRPFSITRPGKGGVDAPPPPGVSKLGVVALRGKKTNRLLSTSTRDWWYIF